MQRIQKCQYGNGGAVLTISRQSHRTFFKGAGRSRWGVESSKQLTSSMRVRVNSLVVKRLAFDTHALR